MLESLIEELKSENLCTHFVLPLLRLNKFSFITSNFVDSYLTREGDKIVVQVIEPQLLSSSITQHRNFRYSAVSTDGMKYYLVFQLPRRWKRDIQLFMEGKFSKMSVSCKEMITCFSGLLYREKQDDKVLTDGKILALERHPLLKYLWETELNIELADDAELLGIPPDRSYIEPDSLIVI